MTKGRKLLLGFREDRGPSGEVSLGITTSALAGYFKEGGEIFLFNQSSSTFGSFIFWDSTLIFWGERGKFCGFSKVWQFLVDAI